MLTRKFPAFSCRVEPRLRGMGIFLETSLIHLGRELDDR